MNLEHKEAARTSEIERHNETPQTLQTESRISAFPAKTIEHEQNQTASYLPKLELSESAKCISMEACPNNNELQLRLDKARDQTNTSIKLKLTEDQYAKFQSILRDAEHMKDRAYPNAAVDFVRDVVGNRTLAKAMNNVNALTMEWHNRPIY